ncbi:MAG: MBOAT family protein [Oscillospiraceae bacterium]|nr:MBOAT family protein [Oscillospiraceae bacterium]
MVFSSLTFLLIFLPLLYILYFTGRAPRWRNGVLLVMSLLFYGWGEPLWILAMLVSTFANFFCARALTRTESEGKRRLILAVGVVFSLSFLFYFKYSSFFANSLAKLLGLGWRAAERRLPIGISFYTFQILTYTVDVYRKKAPALDNPLRLLLYISCFPQLIAGPIVQYADVADQLAERTILPDDFTAGLQRFIKGLGKKVLLANVCGAAMEELTLAGTGAPLSLLGAWLAVFLYGMQIYFDFSAYSDMAIGLGQTLGFRYKENFRFPYASLSVTEFWRRWHISMGSFFRDYVYIPLGGNRRGTARTVLNMLLVWALTGLWHGAAWNFVLWGLYFGVLLILERFVLRGVTDHLPRLLRWLIAFTLVTISWSIFYYTDLGSVAQALGALFGVGISGASDPASITVLRSYGIWALGAFVLSLPLVPAVAGKLPEKTCGLLGTVLTVLIFAASLLFLIGQSYNPFIYFRF